jgi:ATP-dependent Lhr-like helicase
LSPGIKRWVTNQKWSGFRDVQETAIKTLLTDDNPPNIIISAPTSAGKTEAAMLPALSILENYYADNPDARFCCMLWVAPLKALLSDTMRRMQEVAKHTHIPVYLWHGDAAQGQKNEMMREHDGIILITPESLESFLVNRGTWVNKYMTPMVVVVDEFHAFLGAGRGKQMLSLLDRIDMVNAQHGMKPAIRIGLSATLSKLDTVASILSPRAPYAVIDGTTLGGDELEISVKTFDPPIKREGQKDAPKDDLITIGKDIINGSVGEKTLTFASSRLQVESISSTINDICKADNIKSQAFPHHGSLSKDTREALEHRLVSTDKPTMAIATITLELGIDIGDIYKVFQVGTPNSVASLRQRIGRSGRRDGHKRCECLITGSDKPETMENDLVNIIAEIELMNAGWFEPPQNKRRDISVLVSEILSVVKQYESAYEDDLFSLLVTHGAFYNVPRDLFGMVVRDMLDNKYLEELPGGMLILGLDGEKEVQDYHFYATFQTEETYTVKTGNKSIGEIMPPATSLMMLNNGGTFMLGGRYWQVVPPIDTIAKVINVRNITSKAKFLVPTSRGCGNVGGMVRKTAIRLLNGNLSDYKPSYIDEESLDRLEQAREYARTHKLNGLGISIYDGGEAGSETDSEVYARAQLGYNQQALLTVNPPVDQPVQDAITKTLMFAGMEDPSGLNNMPKWRMDELVDAVLNNWEVIEKNREMLLDETMLDDIRGGEKYNWIFAPETLRYAYVEERIDLAGAKKWFEAYKRFAG